MSCRHWSNSQIRSTRSSRYQSKRSTMSKQSPNLGPLPNGPHAVFDERSRWTGKTHDYTLLPVAHLEMTCHRRVSSQKKAGTACSRRLSGYLHDAQSGRLKAHPVPAWFRTNQEDYGHSMGGLTALMLSQLPFTWTASLRHQVHARVQLIQTIDTEHRHVSGNLRGHETNGVSHPFLAVGRGCICEWPAHECSLRAES